MKLEVDKLDEMEIVVCASLQKYFPEPNDWNLNQNKKDVTICAAAGHLVFYAWFYDHSRPENPPIFEWPAITQTQTQTHILKKN